MNSIKFSFKIKKTLTFLGIMSLLLNACNGINRSTWIYA